MSTALDELDPFSPEYEAEVERLQNEEDAANGNIERGARPAQSESEAGNDDDDTGQEANPHAEAQEQAADTGAQPAAPAADDANATTDAQAQEAPSADATKVAGVASKDGTKVLPYGALQGARNAAKAERQARERAEAEAERLRAENEALKQGKPIAAAKPEGDELSADDLEDLKNLSPEVAAKVERLQSRAKQAPAEQPAEDPAAAQEREREAVQEDIDSVPALVEWQHADPEKWSRAVAIDGVLKTSRKWADKPRSERFAEVARQVADEYDIQIDSAPSRSNQVPSRAKPAAPQIARTPPSTLSDFKGGAAPATDPTADLSPAALYRKFEGMTNEQIDAYLEKLG